MRLTVMQGASGKVGVCLATSGPGATNLVTGIATAFMDSIPVGNYGKCCVKSSWQRQFSEVDILVLQCLSPSIIL